jgi:hypothetical protein
MTQSGHGGPDESEFSLASTQGGSRHRSDSRLHRASAGTICPRYCLGRMDRNKNNPNWQDKLLGGAILTGFVVTAVVAVLLTLMTWSDDQRKAASPETTVDSSTHASRPTPHSMN